MSSSRELNIALVSNTIYGDSDYERSIWDGACQAAAEEGVRLCTFSGGQIRVNGDGTLNKSFVYDIALEAEVDGFLLNAATIGVGIDHRYTQSFASPFGKKPCVAIAHEIEQMSYIGIDNVRGMQDMIGHLIANLGAKRVAYVSGPLSNPEARDRLSAYKDVLKMQGIAVDESLIFEGSWTAPSGVQAISRWIDRGVKFDAVAAANDLMAVDALNELVRRGVAVPGQVLVSGFDDAPEASFCSPKLSTVFQPIRELGYRGLKLLVQKIRNPGARERLLIPAQVVFRGSAPAVMHAPGSSISEAKILADDADGLRADAMKLCSTTGLQQSAKALSLLKKIPVLLGSAVSTPDLSLEPELQAALAEADGTFLDRIERTCKALWASLPARLRSPGSWERISELLLHLDNAIAERRLTLAFQNAKSSERFIRALVEVNKSLNSVSTLEALRQSIAENLSECGIRTCAIVFFPNEENLGVGKVDVLIENSRISGSQVADRTFQTSRILPQGLPEFGEPLSLVIPLVFEDHKIGYLLFGKGQSIPFAYDALANQIASVLHSVLLITRIESAEREAAERAERIGELVRPMIQTIEETGEMAKEQGSTMQNLALANRETSDRLGESDSHVKNMQEGILRIVDLTGTIDDLSETINVIAINAAIAAARAGSDGKVFGVIASEIRRLSEETKRSTQQITGFLGQLEGSSRNFVLASDATRAVFSRLEGEVDNLLSSLGAIQSSMGDLTIKASEVLVTMNKD